MKMNPLFFRWFVASALLGAALPWAQAQWQWKDQEGRRVYSDQPPPITVPDKDIFKRPAAAREPAAATADNASAPSSAASASASLPLSGKDPVLERRKKEAETQEAAQKKAQAEKAASIRQDNCARAKRAKAQLDSGQRIATINAQGEREIMGDSARSAELKRLAEVIQSDCD
jgi:hypothetical protein